MERLIPIRIVILLAIVFSLISLAGIVLIAVSIETPPTDPSEVNAEITAQGVKLNLTSLIPGIIVFVFGASGLLLLLLKVPVKRILLVPIHDDSDTTKMMMWRTTMSTNYRRELSPAVERIPILLWWMIRSRSVAERVS